MTVKELVNLFAWKEKDNGVIILNFEKWSYGSLLKDDPKFSITNESKDLIKKYGEREILGLGMRLYIGTNVPALLITVSGSMSIDDKE